MKATDLSSSLLDVSAPAKGAGATLEPKPGAKPFESMLSAAIEQDLTRHAQGEGELTAQPRAELAGEQGTSEPRLAQERGAREGRAIALPERAVSIHDSVNRAVARRPGAALRATQPSARPPLQLEASGLADVGGDAPAAPPPSAAAGALHTTAESEERAQQDMAQLEATLGQVAAVVARIVAPPPAVLPVATPELALHALASGGAGERIASAPEQMFESGQPAGSEPSELDGDWAAASAALATRAAPDDAASPVGAGAAPTRAAHGAAGEAARGPDARLPASSPQQLAGARLPTAYGAKLRPEGRVDGSASASASRGDTRTNETRSALAALESPAQPTVGAPPRAESESAAAGAGQTARELATTTGTATQGAFAPLAPAPERTTAGATAPGIPYAPSRAEESARLSPLAPVSAAGAPMPGVTPISPDPFSNLPPELRADLEARIGHAAARLAAATSTPTTTLAPAATAPTLSPAGRAQGVPPGSAPGPATGAAPAGGDVPAVVATPAAVVPTPAAGGPTWRSGPAASRPGQAERAAAGMGYDARVVPTVRDARPVRTGLGLDVAAGPSGVALPASGAEGLSAPGSARELPTTTPQVTASAQPEVKVQMHAGQPLVAPQSSEQPRPPVDRAQPPAPSSGVQPNGGAQPTSAAPASAGQAAPAHGSAAPVPAVSSSLPAAPRSELAAQSAPALGRAAQPAGAASGRGARSDDGRPEPMARIHGYTRGALGHGVSAYAGRGHEGAERDGSPRDKRADERESFEPSREPLAADRFVSPVEPLGVGQPLVQRELAAPAPTAPTAQPALPNPVVELPDFEFAARPTAAQPEAASISLHHPDLGPIQLEVHRAAGRVEVHAVIESAHAEAVLRANESGIRQGVQQSGMNFSALRVRVRGEDPETPRPAPVRRRRANQKEA